MDSILALLEVPFYDIDFGLDSPPPPPPRLPWPNPLIINTISVTSHAKFSREYHVRTCCEIKIWSIEESENQQDKHLLSSILLFSVFVSDLDNHHSPSGVIQIVRSSKGGGRRSEKANKNEQFSIWRGGGYWPKTTFIHMIWIIENSFPTHVLFEWSLRILIVKISNLRRTPIRSLEEQQQRFLEGGVSTFGPDSKLHLTFFRPFSAYFLTKNCDRE